MRAQFCVSPAALCPHSCQSAGQSHGSSGHPRNISVYNCVLLYLDDGSSYSSLQWFGCVVTPFCHRGACMNFFSSPLSVALDSIIYRVQKSPASLTACRAFCVHQASKLSAGTGAFLRQRGLGRGAFSCKRKSPAEPAARKRFLCARMFSGCRGQMLQNKGGRKRRAEKSPPADTKAAEGA